jgi:transposase
MDLSVTTALQGSKGIPWNQSPVQTDSFIDQYHIYIMHTLLLAITTSEVTVPHPEGYLPSGSCVSAQAPPGL